MSLITSYYSKTRKVFRNEEDAKWYYGGNNKDKIRKSLEKNEEVERVGFLLDYSQLLSVLSNKTIPIKCSKIL